MRALAVVAITMLAGASGMAQEKHREELLKHWNITRTLTLQVADAMPAESYGFKPNPEEMSFGEVMNHIAAANASYLSRAAGMKSPLAKPANADKETAKKQLVDSFDYCIKTLQSLTPEQLDRMSGPEGKQMSGRECIWSAFTHTAHHRGQAEVYLRVKGIKPPTYMF